MKLWIFGSEPGDGRSRYAYCSVVWGVSTSVVMDAALPPPCEPWSPTLWGWRPPSFYHILVHTHVQYTLTPDRPSCSPASSGGEVRLSRINMLLAGEVGFSSPPRRRHLHKIQETSSVPDPEPILVQHDRPLSNI